MKKKPATVVLLGDKDHGKSTILGRLLFDTGSVTPEKVNALKKGAAFEWAHLMDSFREERSRQMTIDIAPAAVQIGRRSFTFVDVPGHGELIKNRVTGATLAEIAVLVISGQEGITQETERHIALAKFLRLRKIIVAINKMDLLQNNPAAFRKHSIEIRRLLKKFGMSLNAIIPISAIGGENLVRRSRRMRWYKGPTLAQAIVKIEFKAPLGPFIGVVQDVYGENIIGVVLSGKTKAGEILRLLPHGVLVRIKRCVIADSNFRFVLTSSEQKIERGNIVTSSLDLKPQHIVSAECIMLEDSISHSYVAEADFNETKLQKPVFIKNTDGLVMHLRSQIDPPIVIVDKFVLRRSGRIAGICRLL